MTSSGARDQSAGDREPAAHPTGKLIDPGLPPVFQLRELEELGRASARLLAWHVEVAGVDDEIVEDGELVIERVVLQGRCRAPPGFPDLEVAGSVPRTVSVPLVAGDMHPIIRIVELLPAPFGPRNPKTSPGQISKSIPSTAYRNRRSLGQTTPAETTGTGRIARR